jgi:KaiC/GvpD/RAD55 family RecA-like ATPase
MLEEAPGWLIDVCRQKRARPSAGSHEPLAPLDHPDAIARAIEYLRTGAPVALEHVNGDLTTFAVAAAVRDLCISEATCFDLMAEHWNEAGGAEPPWPPEGLLVKVENAYRYAQNPLGVRSALAEFEAEILEGPIVDSATPPKPEKRPRLYAVPFTEAADNALVDLTAPLIKGVLDQQTLAVMYGASNTGKTFVMLDLAYHIATGRAWQGRKAARGLVVYVAAEGGRGILKRIAALRAHYGEEAEGVALVVVPCPIDLLHGDGDVKALVALVRHAEKTQGAPAMMVVIDTLSRALAGGDENASTDMGSFIRNVDRIREALRCTLTVVHHSGKDAAKGARGWSGLRAAIDTEIEIAGGQIRFEKQRDLEKVDALDFRLLTIAVGTDRDGDPVTSCVIQIGNDFNTDDLPRLPQDDAMLNILEEAIADEGATGLAHGKWMAALKARMPATKSHDFNNALDRLRTEGLIAKSGRLWTRTAAER